MCWGFRCFIFYVFGGLEFFLKGFRGCRGTFGGRYHVRVVGGVKRRKILATLEKWSGRPGRCHVGIGITLVLNAGISQYPSIKRYFGRLREQVAERQVAGRQVAG
jgi:hypothetical protein